MADKKRPSLTGLTTGTAPLARHVAQKGEETHDKPAREVATKAASGKPRYMQVRLSDADFKKMSVMAAELDVSLQQFALDALNAHRKQNGYPQDLTGPTEK